MSPALQSKVELLERAHEGMARSSAALSAELGALDALREQVNKLLCMTAVRTSSNLSAKIGGKMILLLRA